MFDILFFTAVQIIIEALPISSSGHVLLAQLAWQKYAIQPFTQLPDFFDHFLHGPTVLILLVVFFKDWFYSARHLLIAWWKRIFCQRPLSWSERRLTGIFLKIIGLMCIADAVTAVAYVAKSFMGNDAAIFNDPRVLLVAFCVTAILLLSLLLLDCCQKNCLLRGGAGGNGLPVRNFILRWILNQVQDDKKARIGTSNNSLTIKKSIILGAVQGLALLFSGLSRFGSTYVIGRWLGLSPRRSFQFSFLIQFPLIAAAFVLNGIRGLIKNPEVAAFLNIPLMATMIGATIISGLLFTLVYRLALRRRLGWIGVYMLVPIMILLIINLLG